jgi:hypothetical protein
LIPQEYISNDPERSKPITAVSWSRLLILLGLILVIVPVSASVEQVLARQSGLVRVMVVSETDGLPLPGANVLLFDTGTAGEGAQPDFFCTTNSDGFCEIRNVPARQPFTLTVSFVGYRTQNERVVLQPGERRIIRALLETDTGELDELTVTRQRYVTTGEAGVRRISVADIARVPSPVAGGDLAGYLQTVPGVVTAGDRGGELYIRGGTPDQNLVLIDRLPVVKPFHISNLFSVFPDEIIQSADFFAGGFDARYVGATSAVLDVTLRPGNMRNHLISASASPYMIGFHAEGPLVEDEQSLIVSGRLSTIERFGPQLTGEDIPIRFGNLVARYSLLDEAVSCNITGVLSYDRGEIVPYRGIEHSWSNTVIGGRCIGYGGWLSHPVDISFGYTGYRNAEGTKDVRERYSATGQLFMNITLPQHIAGIPVDYGFGVNFRSYRIELSERFTQFLNLTGLYRTVPNVYFSMSAVWSPTQHIQVQPGVLSQFTMDTPLTLEPRLRISVQPFGDDRTQISLSTGRYVQTYSGVSDERDTGTVFTALTPVGRGDPLPVSHHGIIAFQQKFGRFFTANIEAFYKEHSHIPVSKWTPEPRLVIETALADGQTYGFDVRLSWNGNPFFASAGYGWTKVEYEASTGDLGAWIQETIFSYSPAHDQRHKLNTVASYRFAPFTVNASWEFGTGTPFTQLFGFDFAVRVPAEHPAVDPGVARTLYSRPYGERLPYYHRLDLSVERGFRLASGWMLETSAGVINLYNRNNIFNVDLNTLQRVDQTPLLPYISIRLRTL